MSTSNAPSETSSQTYTGGCHCGYLRYTFDADLSNFKGGKCNCTTCHKLNLLPLLVHPTSNFTLLSPASRQDAGLVDYVHGEKRIHFYSCKTCGVTCFYEGWFPHPRTGERWEILQVNAVTLDPDQLDLTKFKTVYWDGRRDNWTTPGETPWPGGCF